MMSKQKKDPYARSSSGDQITIIIPIYNEINDLRTVLPVLNQSLPNHVDINVIFIESNSSDGSRELLLKSDFSFNHRIILQDKPKGKGSAVREAMDQVSQGIIAIFDSDREYQIEDLWILVEGIQTGRSSFLLGLRPNFLQIRKFQDQKMQSFVMNLGHHFFTLFFNILFRTRFKDPVTMWKVFRFEAIDGISFKANRFDFDFELLAKCIRNGCKPIEIPIRYKSRSFKEGKKIRPIRDSINWIFSIPKFKFEKLKDF